VMILKMDCHDCTLKTEYRKRNLKAKSDFSIEYGGSDIDIRENVINKINKSAKVSHASDTASVERKRCCASS